jgi:acetyltransferase
VERIERNKMHRNNIPVFPTPERAVRALAQVISADRKGKPAATTFPAASGRAQLGLFDSLQFLEKEGFDCIFSRFADSPGMAAHLAHRLGFPVALKIDSPDILHKSDVGGVRLHLQSGQDVQLAYDQMMLQVKEHCPGARLNGAVVSPMAFAGLEVILGMSRDPQFGPVILFGLGGVTVELFRDVALRPLPLDRQQAREMIDETKGAPLLKGFRGQPVLDEKAVVDALLKLAQIAGEHPEIMEIDLNPVRVYRDGLVVVDARILKG